MSTKLIPIEPKMDAELDAETIYVVDRDTNHRLGVVLLDSNEISTEKFLAGIDEGRYSIILGKKMMTAPRDEQNNPF